MSAMTSGRVRLRCSLQPSYGAPPKSSAESPRAWIIVPIAPSSTRMRRPSSCARRADRSGKPALLLPSPAKPELASTRAPMHRIVAHGPGRPSRAGSAAPLPAAEIHSSGAGAGVLPAGEHLRLLDLLGAGGGQRIHEEHPARRLEVGEAPEAVVDKSLGEGLGR